ncbi:MAG TPA: YceI family protein [Candidatus Binatia bacterium]|jgi:polyisoprenoid-binding protein YceI
MNRFFFAPASLALAATLAFSFCGTARAEVQTFEIDHAHSSVTFKIRHLLSTVPGKFKSFKGTIKIDPDKRDSVQVDATIDTASIDTDETKRDDHLRSPDFFDAARFPTIKFTGNKLTDVNADHTKAKLEGMLTMRDVTKPIVLDVQWLGMATDPMKNLKAAGTATASLNRKDFGIVWNKTMDNGGLLVGDDVSIEINVEAQIPKPVQ